MSKFTSPLDNVHVAAPCSANWEEMNGDEQVRHCGSCQLNVYNLSAMTRREAEKLLIEREGRLCVRFYRRADGTIITQNCPKGIAAIKRRVSRAATAMFSTAITFLSGIGIYSAVSSVPQKQVRQGEIAMPFDQTKLQNGNTEVRQPYYETMGANLPVNIQGNVELKGKPQHQLYSIKTVKRTNK